MEVRFPKLFQLIDQLIADGRLDDGGWRQLDRDLTQHLLYRSVNIIAPVKASSNAIGARFNGYARAEGIDGWGKKSRRYP